MTLPYPDWLAARLRNCSTIAVSIWGPAKTNHERKSNMKSTFLHLTFNLISISRIWPTSIQVVQSLHICQPVTFLCSPCFLLFLWALIPVTFQQPTMNSVLVAYSHCWELQLDIQKISTKHSKSVNPPISNSIHQPTKGIHQFHPPTCWGNPPRFTCANSPNKSN